MKQSEKPSWIYKILCKLYSCTLKKLCISSNRKDLTNTFSERIQTTLRLALQDSKFPVSSAAPSWGWSILLLFWNLNLTQKKGRTSPWTKRCICKQKTTTSTMKVSNKTLWQNIATMTLSAPKQEIQWESKLVVNRVAYQ